MAATEFTPEITEDFYNTLSKRIKDRGQTTAGQARSEALSRGLGGDPYEASAVGLAQQGTNSELNDLDSGLNFQVAGLNREERLGNQSRDWQVQDRDFGAAEADKDRAFREKLAKMGYDWQGDQANTANRRAQQAAIWQTGLGVVGKGLGAWAAGGA